jgi:hypothetical protein
MDDRHFGYITKLKKKRVLASSTPASFFFILWGVGGGV